jgi:spoIIIJ-associated protein
VKDQVFSGRTVSEAVEIAGRTLGLAPDALRYVVLERETPGALGVGGTSARIAVLLERGAGRPGPQAAERRHERESNRRGTERGETKRVDPLAAIRALVRDFSEASELDLTAEVQTEGEKTIVRMFGADKEILLADGGEVLLALEHVLQRAFGRELYPSRLIVECEGFREARDAGLIATARQLAAEVRGDGQSRETEPLNAYERRIVHMTIAEEAGLRTFSVGEGQDRRVTIAVQEPGSEESGSGGAEEV